MSTRLDRAYPPAPLRKNPTLKVKASGFFSRLKPQLNIDTSPAVVRRFSFETGDDANASLSAPPIDTLPASVRQRLIRKSTSMSSLEIAHHKTTAQESTLPPVAQSPINFGPLDEWTQTPPDYDDSKRPSRIPTPVYKANSMARPRRERDDSASSLLTAIKHSEAGSRKSDSLSSSSYSSPSASRTDLTQAAQNSDAVQGSIHNGSRSNTLLDHTNVLRGSSVAVAAAKAASASTTVVDQGMVAEHGQRPSVQRSNNSRSSTRSQTHSDMGELRKENRRPIGRAPDMVHDSSATR